MADGPVLELSDAVIALLRANADVSALVGARVYDEPPQDVDFPYVRVGTMEASALRIGCFTDDDIVFSVECHSRPAAGRVEARRMAHAVRIALDDAALLLSNYVVDWCDYLTQAVDRSPTGDGYTATVAFAASLSEAGT